MTDTDWNKVPMQARESYQILLKGSLQLEYKFTRIYNSVGTLNRVNLTFKPSASGD